MVRCYIIFGNSYIIHTLISCFLKSGNNVNFLINYIMHIFIRIPTFNHSKIGKKQIQNITEQYRFNWYVLKR